MKEATIPDRFTLLVIFFICTIYISFPCYVEAQTSQPNSRLSQLLDSAEILKLKGFYDEAISICKDVLAIAERNKDWASYSRSLAEHADVLRFSYYYTRDAHVIDESLKLLDRSKKLIDQYFGGSHIVLSRYFLYKGKIVKDTYNKNAENKSDKVFQYFSSAKDVVNSFSNEPKELAKVINELALFYHQADSVNMAKLYYKKLLILVEANFDKLDYFRALYLYNIGNFYNNIGDLERSNLCLTLAIDIYKHPGINDNKNAIRVEIDLANNLFYSNEQSSEALIHYNAAIILAKQLGASEYNALLLSYTNSGHALYRLNLIDSSILISKKSILLNRKETSRDSLLLSFAYKDIGMAMLNKNRVKEAESYFNKSEYVILKVLGPKEFFTYVVYHDIGVSYEQNDQIEKSLDYYQKGLRALYKNFNSMDIYANPQFEDRENLEEAFYILFDKSGALYKRFLKNGEIKDLGAAYFLYKKGYELFSDLLNTGFMEESIAQLFGEFKDEFNSSIDCAFTYYEETGEEQYIHQAFKFMEQSKYFLLFQSQLNSILKDLTGTSDSIFIVERELTQRIAEEKHRLSDPEITNREIIFSRRNKLLELLMKKSNIWDQIKGIQSKGLVQLSDRMILTLDDVQKNMIKQNDIIIEYHWSNEDILALVIGKEFVNVTKVSLTSDLLDQIQKLTSLLSGKNSSNDVLDNFKSYVFASNYIYEELFKPIIKLASGYLKDENPKITIVPDGALSFLPFEALTTEMTDTTKISYWSLKYLCKEYAIRYAYSLNILNSNLTNRNVVNDPKILAMSFSSKFDKSKDISQLRFDNELPYSGEEVQKIKNIFSGKHYYEGENATEQLFKSKASEFSLLHLALHGKADIIDKYNSKLIFKNDPDSEEDGQLYAYELYTIDLSKAQLAVLSACETGLGKYSEGEGVFSIARGFAYAGCPAILMSLWKVNDKATANLMEYYYQNLSQGMDKDVALQQAKITFIENSNDFISNPENWAAFISIGNSDPITVPKENMEWYPYLLLIIFIFSIIFILNRKFSLR